MGTTQWELLRVWTFSRACVFTCGDNPSRVWLRASSLIGTDSTRTITPPRCSWDHTELSSICQATRRWRSRVQGEAGAYRYLWLWCRSGMARSPGEMGAGIWWFFVWLERLYLFSRVQPEDRDVIHYVVMDSLAHLQKLIDKYCGSRTIFRQIRKNECLKAFPGQQFSGWAWSSHA